MSKVTCYLALSVLHRQRASAGVVLGTLAAGLLAAPVAADPMFGTEVAGIDILESDELPPAPAQSASADDLDFCGHYFVETPKTAAGRLVESLGWHVTAEVEAGEVTAVSFLAEMTPGMSGTCTLIDGNIGLFADDQLLALVYGSEEGSTQIGKIRPLEPPDGLRIWSGEELPQPIADLWPIDTIGAHVTPLAQTEKLCQGQASVPFIYGLPVDRARQMLMAAVWAPVPHTDKRESLYCIANEVAAAGVTEVEDCSGTGFGFCIYTYEGVAGKLTVRTYGDIGEGGRLPLVDEYWVDCR
ncbi:MAG: hypothetical protein ACK4FR_11480 [Tabrizicola sp.]